MFPLVYDGKTGVRIASLYGDDANDSIGSSGVTALTNGNYVVSSSYDDVAGVSDAGSVKLLSGATGAVIASLDGDNASDYMGSSGVTALPNGNYVVSSPSDDVAGVSDAGSVKLLSGATGTLIASLYGNNAGDYIGYFKVTALLNGNSVVRSPLDHVAGVNGAGSVKLVNGATGVVIASLDGDNPNDMLGYSGVTELSNGNYVVRSSLDDVAGVSDAGSVKLIDGASGALIGSLVGDNANDSMGNSGATALPNGNYVVSSSYDDVAGVSDAGSVKLVNGATGAVIASLDGDNAGDKMGSYGVPALPNGGFIVFNPAKNNHGFMASGQMNFPRFGGHGLRKKRVQKEGERYGKNEKTSLHS